MDSETKRDNMPLEGIQGRKERMRGQGIKG